jgi:hypothetical protein
MEAARKGRLGSVDQRPVLKCLPRRSPLQTPTAQHPGALGKESRPSLLGGWRISSASHSGTGALLFFRSLLTALVVRFDNADNV